jgi:hypothetical protein
MSAGWRHIWFDKQNPLVTFLDRRREVNPTFVCDTRSIPAEGGGGYDLVVFDPPHANVGKNSDMAKQYGYSITDDIRATVRGSAKEAWRVSKPNALMAFKWNDCGQKLEKVIPMLEGWEPLFGHGLSIPGRHKSSTYWVLLRRIS